MMSKPGVSYDSIKPRLATYDLIAFRGASPFSKTVIAAQQLSSGYGNYTHVGIVIRGSDFPVTSRYHDPSRVYIFESVASGPNPESDGIRNVDGGAFLGVQLRDLDRVVASYDRDPETRIAWGSLKDRPSLGRLNELFTKYNGKGYDANPISICAAPFACFRLLRECFRCCPSYYKNYYICSEFAATFYNDLGIMKVTPQNVIPVDFFTPSQLGEGSETVTVDVDHEVPALFAEVVPFHY